MIEFRNLQKVVDGQTVLDIESLTIEPGQVAGFIGPVDSHLGVIFELLTGRERPTAGSIRISGIDPYHDRGQFSHRVGVVFAEDNLYQRQTVQANLNFYRRLYRLPAARVQEVIGLVGLADQADAIVGDLGPGLARRLAFGRAILHQPAVLLLNEPFKESDGATVTILSGLIQGYTRDGSVILILLRRTSRSTCWLMWSSGLPMDRWWIHIIQAMSSGKACLLKSRPNWSTPLPWSIRQRSISHLRRMIAPSCRPGMAACRRNSPWRNWNSAYRERFFCAHRSAPGQPATGQRSHSLYPRTFQPAFEGPAGDDHPLE